MDLGIAEKVALVTGGSRGLGRQAALSLAAEGAKVAICARTQENLDAVLPELTAAGARHQPPQSPPTSPIPPRLHNCMRPSFTNSAP